MLSKSSTLLRREGDFIFPNGRGKPLSNTVLLTFLVKSMGRAGLTVHGFRSSFRDWAAEQTNFPSEVREAALAHVVATRWSRPIGGRTFSNADAV